MNTKPITGRKPYDVVYTNSDLAKRLINHFKPQGLCLDPCRGRGSFYNHLPYTKDWCDIADGRDFLDWTKPVQWIITNPPWSSAPYRAISQHAFDLANNVVFLVRLHNAIGTKARQRDYVERGHQIKEIVVVDWEEAGFPNEGFVLAAFHWAKHWPYGTKWTYWV